MTSSSPIHCTACGAVHQTQVALCAACGQLLRPSVEDTALPSLAESPASPALLAGRYRVVGMVGKGGFGAVYKAEDVQRRGLFVAIKQINLTSLSPREMIEATDTFNREVRLLSGLTHPNLPRIYEHFTDAEHWYLAMDFIEGETLEEYLDRAKGGHLPVEEVLNIGIQLCTVLDYLHTRQPPIIFRDVKPANIMRTAMGQLYLIDFGIARHFTPGQARDTNALGSPGYAAPEQYGKAQTTAQSDIYSLGATLETLLTGKNPLEPTSGYASPYTQEVPVELKLLLVQMLDPDAGKRSASMAAVKQTLQQIKDAPPRVLAAPQLPHSSGYDVPMTSTLGTAGQLPQSMPKRGVSRRAVIIGLVGLVGLATIGGDLTLLALTQGSQSLQGSPNFRDPHLLYTYRGHSSEVDAVAWSPDGKRIASGSRDTTVQVWDASTGSNVLTYTGHSFYGVNAIYDVNAVVWSPDGKHIASGGDDKTVQVWDAITGKKVLTYTGHSYRVRAVAWSPDGKRIASGRDDGTVQVWNAAGGDSVATTGANVFTYWGHSDRVDAVVWSPDGKRIASGSDDSTVQVWDATTGGNVLTYKGHSNGVDAVAWSPDGKRIASGSYDGTVQVWDATTGGNVFTYTSHAYAVNAVAWSPDGKYIASGDGDNTVQVWDAITGKKVLTYRGHSAWVNAVIWSPYGGWIASGGADNTVQVWKAP